MSWGNRCAIRNTGCREITDVTDSPPSYGPRERILHVGECRLSDAECLALILRTGRRGESAEQMGQRLLRQFGGAR